LPSATTEMTVAGKHLEVRHYAPRGHAVVSPRPPTLVFLHEGLGSVGLWRDFPQALADATGCPALAYSRQGYGRSAPIALPRPLSFMHDEARTALPALLAAAGISDAILVGHSDGASIALIYAGEQGGCLRALVLEAPHVFVEEVSVISIARARESYRAGPLRERLARHHGDNVDGAFYGWADSWLDPGFRSWNIEEFLPAIKVPILLIQGEDDEYGTLAQIERIERQVAAPVERCILAQCGHAPHRDQPAATLAAMAAFINKLG